MDEEAAAAPRRPLVNGRVAFAAIHHTARGAAPIRSALDRDRGR
jgi:hypothetical protein